MMLNLVYSAHGHRHAQPVVWGNPGLHRTRPVTGRMLFTSSFCSQSWSPSCTHISELGTVKYGDSLVEHRVPS